MKTTHIEKKLALLVLCAAATTAIADEQNVRPMQLAEATAEAQAAMQNETSRSDVQKMLELNQTHQQDLQAQLQKKQEEKLKLAEQATSSGDAGMMQKVKQNEMEQQQLQKTLMLKKQEEMELRKVLESSKQ